MPIQDSGRYRIDFGAIQKERATRKATDYCNKK
jgi:hypothetical protein